MAYKSAVLASRLHDAGRIWRFCCQNFVSVSKMAKFVILPFSNPVGIVRTLPAEFYVAFITRLIFLILLIVLIVLVVLSILIDY